MRHRVAELQGELLDAAVAQAEGALPEVVRSIASFSGGYSPSTDGRLGVPIIDRERIELIPQWVVLSTAPDWLWQAIAWRSPDDGVDAFGTSSLVAAMRAFVRARAGDEIELP